MQTLIIDPSYPIDAGFVSPVFRDPIGGGAFAARDDWEKTKTEWTLRFPVDSYEEAEALYFFALRHRGSKPFWFDGANKVERPQVFEHGDGVKQNFMLPFDNVFAATSIFTVNGEVEPLWTLTESIGAVSFTSAPPANSEIAWSGERKAKVIFYYDAEVMYGQAEFCDRLFDEGIKLREVPSSY